MARYQVILAYDGADFAGSQRQASPFGDVATALSPGASTALSPGASTALSPGAKSRTVQGELEKALRKLGWSGRSVLMAGRTDTGVHAAGQVAAFDLDWAHSEDELRDALNAALPLDVAVRAARLASVDFHPRFEAQARRYRYSLFCQRLRDPLRERYAWRVWPPVDGAVLLSLAALWPGRHDFAAFGSAPRPGGDTVRTVAAASWQQHDDAWQFEIQADAFLYRMVRRLVFVQVAAAQGRVGVEVIARALREPAEAASRGVALSTSKDAVLSMSKGAVPSRLPAGLAPAHGLILMEVIY